MTDYLIKVETKSPTLLGSGEGWSSSIDMDIVYDDVGLPYFPARRLKGLLRESAQEIVEMFASSDKIHFQTEDVDKLFGKIGSIEGGLLVLDNLRVPEYDKVYRWCQWALTNYGSFVSQEIIINAQTELREHTSVDENGTAQDNSLRRVRAIRADSVFEGQAVILGNDARLEQLLALACRNLRHVGTSRHRGYGEVLCSLFCGNSNLSQNIIDRLKEVVA